MIMTATNATARPRAAAHIGLCAAFESNRKGY